MGKLNYIYIYICQLLSYASMKFVYLGISAIRILAGFRRGMFVSGRIKNSDRSSNSATGYSSIFVCTHGIRFPSSVRRISNNWPKMSSLVHYI